MKNEESRKLIGGHSTDSVIKIGNTVHRSLNENSEYIHKVLLYLEEKGYKQAPKYLGIDDQGREILTFLDGDIIRGEIDWTGEQLLEIVKIIKEFHNTTEATELAEDKEVVCHNDLAPWNLVMRSSKPVGFIDFDDCTPGYRIDDFAYFLWTFLELGKDIPVDIQAKRIEPLFDEYGIFEPNKLIDSILKKQNNILKKRISLSQNAKTQKERKFSKERIGKIKSEIDWVERHRIEIENYLNKDN